MDDYPLVNVYITMEKSPCLLGKLTINKWPFSIAMSVYQRVSWKIGQVMGR